MTDWLTDDEQRVWRRWNMATSRLGAELNRQLHRERGLGIQDYEVLVFLTDVPEGRRRMSELADLLQWDRSRLSHHITRMAGRELVERQHCTEDGRGAYVAITDGGRAAIEQAAPTHVDGVRDLFFEGLTAEEMDVLDRVTARLLDRLP